MDNQHRQIAGYRELNQGDIALINEAKSLASQVGELCAKLKANEALDGRWIATGTTDLQKGFMSLIRGIAQPTTF